MSNTGYRLDPRVPGNQAKMLEAGLRRLVVGQDEAIRQIVNLYQMYTTGMTAPGRPLGNVLFLGPTGSGKTRLVEAVAETYKRELLRVTAAIHSKASSGAREFGRAFQFKKGTH